MSLRKVSVSLAVCLLATTSLQAQQLQAPITWTTEYSMRGWWDSETATRGYFESIAVSVDSDVPGLIDFRGPRIHAGWTGTRGSAPSSEYARAWDSDRYVHGWRLTDLYLAQPLGAGVGTLLIGRMDPAESIDVAPAFSLSDLRLLRVAPDIDRLPGVTRGVWALAVESQTNAGLWLFASGMRDRTEGADADAVALELGYAPRPGPDVAEYDYPELRIGIHVRTLPGTSTWVDRTVYVRAARRLPGLPVSAFLRMAVVAERTEEKGSVSVGAVASALLPWPQFDALTLGAIYLSGMKTDSRPAENRWGAELTYTASWTSYLRTTVGYATFRPTASSSSLTIRNRLTLGGSVTP